MTLWEGNGKRKRKKGEAEEADDIFFNDYIVPFFVAHDGERCKPPAYHSLEGFQHVGIFQLFEVKLESCVFWLADIFFIRRRKVIISNL